MREKQFTVSITFFTTPTMYKAIKDVSDELRVSLSTVMREAISTYLEVTGYLEKEKN